MPSASELDAVTVDAFGTLLVLEDPVERFRRSLAARDVERSPEAVREAFRAEARYYRPRSLAGRDQASLAALRLECVRLFLDHLEAPLEPASFLEEFMQAFVFHPAAGALRTVATLRAAGLALACVANWDVSLGAHLERLGLASLFDVILTSAEAGAAKPDPRIFALALDRLGVAPARALHIGDEEADREGARAAGLAFEPVPLATLPERLGL